MESSFSFDCFQDNQRKNMLTSLHPQNIAQETTGRYTRYDIPVGTRKMIYTLKV